jgi:hypothetical protein
MSAVVDHAKQSNKKGSYNRLPEDQSTHLSTSHSTTDDPLSIRDQYPSIQPQPLVTNRSELPTGTVIARVKSMLAPNQDIEIPIENFDKSQMTISDLKIKVRPTFR